MDKLSYALGLSMGNNFQRSGVRKLNAEDFAAALKAVYGEGEMLMTYDEAIKRVEQIVSEMEQSEALSMDAYQAKAKEAKDLLIFCQTQLTDWEKKMEDMIASPTQQS